MSELPDKVCDVLESLPCAEDWRDNLNLSRAQSESVTLFAVNPKVLQESQLTGMHGHAIVYGHPYGTLALVLGDHFELRYMSNDDSTAGFQYVENGDTCYSLQPYNLPRFSMMNGKYIMSNVFEDVTAFYGDLCALEFGDLYQGYSKKDGLLLRDGFWPSFRCKSMYTEKEFRDMVYNRNMKSFRPSLCNLLDFTN